jgi:hypothetical protein
MLHTSAIYLLALAALRSPTKTKGAFALAANEYLPDGQEPQADQIFTNDHKNNMHIAKIMGIKSVGKVNSHLPHLTLRGKRDSDEWRLHLDVRHHWTPESHGE